MTFLEIGLYVSAAICLAGFAWRLGKRGRSMPPKAASAAATGDRTGLIQTAIKDVLLLGRTWGRSRCRWLSHGLILLGFGYLLLFHALAAIIPAKLFPGYAATLDPWQWLRNLAGFMVLVGLALALIRRLKTARLRRLTRFQDWALLLLVGAIVASGFCLEAGKIISPAVFQRMTEDYLDADDPEDVAALKYYWARENGVIFSLQPSGDADSLERGAELNEYSCAGCHSPTKSALVSRALARMTVPVGQVFNRFRLDRLLYYSHILLCFLGLVLLPWGKFIHPLTTPLNLLGRRGRRDSGGQTPIRRRVSRAACTRCGDCTLHCSVAPAFTILGNPDILPSEKLISLNGFQAGRLGPEQTARLAQGSRLCSECLRCTDVCPSGIDLQDLWLSSKPDLATPAQEIQTGSSVEWAAEFRAFPETPLEFGPRLADRAETFQPCLQCTICTGVCPVASASADSVTELDLTPQQVMNMLRLGLKNEAMASGMVWSCTTCYKCQEHCPRGIPAADVLTELRQTAVAFLNRPGRGGRS